KHHFGRRKNGISLLHQRHLPRLLRPAFLRRRFVGAGGKQGERHENKQSHQCLPNSFSTSAVESFTHVGRPWLHWPDLGVRSISRSSAFISTTDRVRPARTEPWQAIVASTCSIFSPSSRLCPCCARSSARSRSSASASAFASAEGMARTSIAPG